MKKSLLQLILKISAVLGGVYLFLFLIFYFFQESLMFFPQELSPDYQFQFDAPFEEVNVLMENGISINNLWFKTDSSKGVIFYLHGNGGSLKGWGRNATVYLNLGYDVFMTDFRGYGKSEGSISNEEQLHNDIQTVYNHLKTMYDENQIIVLGYSLGTGMASRLAANNNPALLILQAPLYNTFDLVENLSNSPGGFLYKILSFMPSSWMVKYKWETNLNLQNSLIPTVIFHGDADEVIYHGASVKLKKYFKPGDKLITLKGQKHNGMTRNPEYISELKKVLNELN